VHRRVLVETWTFFEGTALHPQALAESPIKGGEGNTEFLLRLALDAEAASMDAAIRGLGFL
jgi:hypothetical protein